MKALVAAAAVVSALSGQMFAQAPIAGRLPERNQLAAVRPAPRLASGQPDLGNGKGVWNPRVVANLAGVGDPNRSPVERMDSHRKANAEIGW